MGALAFHEGQYEVAERYLRRAIELLSDNPVFHHNLSLVYRQLGRFPLAVECCRRAVELAPQMPELHNSLGIALRDAGDSSAAMASLQRAIELRPTYADAHYNRGALLAERHLLAEAEAEYRLAIQYAPQDSEPYNNLGALVQLQGRYAEAMSLFEQALRCRPDSVNAHRNRGLLNLLHGKFLQGWGDYEWRWRMSDAQRPLFAGALWQGQDFRGRTVLLWCEQGIGDTIQFIRYAPWVKQHGARVLVACSPRLHPLLSTAPGIDRLVDERAGGETFDFYIPLLTLPSVAGTTVETIPAATSYLAAEPDRVAQWHQKLGDYRGFKVGIAWQGNPTFKGDYYRSVPLSCFAPLAACQGVQLFSLQKNFGREQLDVPGQPASIVDLGTTLDETTGTFVETAAVMRNLDLVISTDTAIAHLAGAMGVPVWVALPLDPNWRWLLAREDCPWYPSMRLFRQTSLGTWSDVFANMADQLRTLVAQRRT
jgi:Flp pilus assembly protein TadD